MIPASLSAVALTSTMTFIDILQYCQHLGNPARGALIRAFSPAPSDDEPDQPISTSHRVRRVVAALVPHEGDELFERGPLGAQSIDGRRFVAMANRHAAEQHQLRAQLQEFADRLGPNRPCFLRTGP